jgi:HSP20 family molecular chaperone IbpA
MQAVPLPDDAKTDQVNAKYTNGVLTVRVGRAKKEHSRAQSQKISVQ